MSAKGFSPAVRKVIAVRAMDFNLAWPVCEIMSVCQGEDAVAIHHRRPRGSGGSKRTDTNRPPNGLATCDPCHLWVELNRERAFGFGWLLHQAQVPAEEPVLRRGVWVLLDDAGDFERVAAPVVA